VPRDATASPSVRSRSTVVSYRSSARDSLDPTHVGPHASLGQNLEDAEFAGRPDMGATAQLPAEVVDFDDAHKIAILLAEQRHRTEIPRVFQTGCESTHRMVLHDAPVHEFLNIGKALRPQRFVVGKVEAQLVRPHGGPGLGDILAKTRAQRVVKQMRRRMFAAMSWR